MTQQVGVHHASVKDLIALRDNRLPPAGRLVVEGMWGHEIVLDSGAPVETFFWCEEVTTSPRFREVARQVAERADRTLIVSPKVLAKISERKQPDGLVSVVRVPEHDLSHLDRRSPGLVVVADGLEIPGNVGTLLRTMDAVAADALLCVNRRVRISHPKVFRASHGMVLHVPVVDFPDVPTLAAWLRKRDFTVYSLDVYAGHDPLDTAWAARSAIVLGNERYGTSREWEQVPQQRVRLPMLGHADSLNVAVAGSIAAFHARARMSRDHGDLTRQG